MPWISRPFPYNSKLIEMMDILQIKKKSKNNSLTIGGYKGAPGFKLFHVYAAFDKKLVK